MLNGNTISVQELIREIYRDYGYKIQLPWQDAIEWAVDAIELIGAPQALSHKQAKITIENYRGKLPCDLHDIQQAAGSFDGCIPFPMRLTTNTFGPVFTCEDEQILPELLADTDITSSTTEPIGEDISGNPVYTFQNGNMSMPETITAASQNVALFNSPTYSVSESHIFPNFQEGCVFIAYNALPVDDDGFPLIPDNRRYKEAVKCYIRYKIDYMLWRTNEITRDKFEYSEREWMFYVGSAGSAARIPNVDGMQGLLNAMRLIPQRFAHQSFFRNLGS